MKRLACLLVISALLCPALQAQPAFLVEDINPGVASPSWPHETEWVSVGGLAVFTRPDSVHGIEIWKSDGTAAGTSPILDICPGICSSYPRSLAVVGSVVFFHADDGVHGPSLWKSDGTAAGTTLVREEVSPFRTVALGSVLLFQSYSQEGRELWRSDGTRDGTFLLTGFTGQSGSPSDWLGYAGGLMLFASDHPVHGHGLWKTDGTVAGTSFIKSMEHLWERPLTGGLYPSIGGRLFFLSNASIWVSDGTLAGTFKVSGVYPLGGFDGYTPFIAAMGNEVFFSGRDSMGDELWKSDGTEAGTVRVKDINPGTGSSQPTEIIALGDRVFFRTSTSPALWKSDGTEAGTVPVAPSVALGFKEGYNGFQAFGDKLAFFASANGTGREPWVTDGTGAGTMLLADIYPGIASSFDNGGWYALDHGMLSQLDGGAVAGGQWIFRAQTPSGMTAWKSDGTPAGTGLIESVNGGAPGGVYNLADLDGTLIFTASDDGEENDLWRSDGSAPEISRIDAPAFSDGPRYLTRLGGHVYFTSSGSLWRTDGAAPEVFDDEWWILYLKAAGPHLFYLKAPRNGSAHRLEATDGTAITQILGTGSWNLGHFTAAGTNLFFTQRTHQVGEELWKSAGAPNDAVMLRRFPYMWPPQMGSIGGFGNSVFFAANDGSTGQELWFSDGTVAGTRLVKDIVPGAGSSNPRSIAAAGSVVFFIADDGVTGSELWRTDGTASGTFRVKDIRPGSESSWIRGFTAHGGRVYFAADDGVNGVELWTSDGSEAGTVLVEDIRPGAGSSFPGAFQVTGHAVLFAADDGEHGLEVWRTDGTAPGTFLVQDVFPGPEPSSPMGFTLSGGYVYFIANDGAHGFELWALDRAAPAIAYPPADFHTVVPCRVLDTRSSTALASGIPRNVAVGGACGIPATATAVAANLTVLGATARGNLVVYPAGIPVPATSNVNFSAGQMRANSAQLPLAGGHADARAFVMGGGTVHLIVDVTGYYEQGSEIDMLPPSLKIN